MLHKFQFQYGTIERAPFNYVCALLELVCGHSQGYGEIHLTHIVLFMNLLNISSSFFNCSKASFSI